MTYPDTSPIPSPPTPPPWPGGPRTVPARRCQQCGRHAEIYDLDGCWCTPACRRRDREGVRR